MSSKLSLLDRLQQVSHKVSDFTQKAAINGNTEKFPASRKLMNHRLFELLSESNYSSTHKKVELYEKMKSEGSSNEFSDISEQILKMIKRDLKEMELLLYLSNFELVSSSANRYEALEITYVNQILEKNDL